MLNTPPPRLTHEHVGGLFIHMAEHALFSVHWSVDWGCVIRYASCPNQLTANTPPLWCPFEGLMDFPLVSQDFFNRYHKHTASFMREVFVLALLCYNA